jgi:hypothetical protein
MIKRIISLPFFAVFVLIAAIALWVKYCVNFIKFGGEAIVYTNANQRKTILDIYERLEK